MKITESFLRQIIREEISRNFLNEADAADARKAFIMASNNPEKHPSRAVDPGIERARETNVARDRAREELGIRRR